MGIQEGDYLQVEMVADGMLVLGKHDISAVKNILKEFQEAVKSVGFTREELKKTT